MTTRYQLPESALAEFAPLPKELAQHLYSYCIRQGKVRDVEVPLDQILQRLIDEMMLVRQTICLHMNTFVRNLEKGAPYEYQFSTAWLMDALRRHNPGKRPISKSTFTGWIDRGVIRVDSKGRPTYESAVAIQLLRIFITGQRLNPPDVASDSPWYFYAQRTPDSDREVLKASERTSLPPATFIWSPGAFPIWRREMRWKLWRNFEGAYAFAGLTEQEGKDGNREYAVTADDMMRWRPHWKRPTSDTLQDRANTALSELAAERFTQGGIL